MDLARTLGLHVTTVSKALKNTPGLAAATRERVLAEAARRGYVPDPLLTGLAAYRSTKRPRALHAALGWIANYPRGTDMAAFAGFDDYQAGAADRARELGYRLEVFHVDAETATSRIARVLTTRAIRGLVLAPQQHPGARLDLPWEQFAAVSIGLTLEQPALHRVTTDHFQTITRLADILRERGYRKIGCHLRPRDDARVERRFSSAMSPLPGGAPLPVLTAELDGPEPFLDWFRAGGFDAVIVGDARCPDWLRAAGYQVPEDVAVAAYALAPHDRSMAGMDHHNRRIGAAAVEWVAALMQRNELGPPAAPERLMIESRWKEGPTLPSQT